MSPSTLHIQQALKAAGHDPGPLDGAPGPRTSAGLRGFQRRFRLPVTGAADPATLAALFPGLLGPDLADPPWFREAERLLGTKEFAGAADNPVILGWAAKLGGWIKSFYVDDAIPWCGLFAAECLRATLPEEGLPGVVLRALDWGKLGVPAPNLPRGAVVTFKRSGGGHVGFLHSLTPSGDLNVLGGNQRNGVNVMTLERDRFVDARWPSTFPLPSSRAPVRRAGARSTNEA